MRRWREMCLECYSAVSQRQDGALHPAFSPPLSAAKPVAAGAGPVLIAVNKGQNLRIVSGELSKAVMLIVTR
jgi:hypothetical protein